MKSLLIGGLLPLFIFSSEIFDSQKKAHPFLGVSKDQHHVKDSDGSHFLRLKRVKTNRKLRKINFSEKEEEFEWVGQTLRDSISSTLFGKSEDQLYFEELHEFLQAHKKQRPVLGAQGDDYPIENTDGQNWEYLMQLYCGSEAEEMSVTFDTGSDWLILQSAASCDTCDGDTWDETQSSTYVQDYPYFDLAYGDAEVYGYYAFDNFYFDEGQTFGFDDFGFMIITWQEGIDPSGGILGFSRDFPFETEDETIDHGPLFLYYMLDQSSITDLIFASYLADDPTESFLQIGDYDQLGTYYTGDLVWLDMIDDFFWLTTSSSYKFKDKEYTYDEVEVELDTGTSMAYLDKGIGKKLQRQLAKGKFGFKWFGYWYLKCDLEKYESFFLEMGGYYFEIPPSSYVVDQTYYGFKWCDLGFYAENMDGIWLLGDVVFRSYYNVWDEANGRIGWAIRTESDATVEPYAA